MVEPTQSLGEIDLKNSTASELADADLASATMNGDLLMQCSDGGPSSLLGAGPPSPLTGCYLMIVIGEPHSDEHKDIILQKLLKGFLSWDSSDCQVDLEEELNTITLHAPEGEEARHGERLIQYASENLVTEILIHPQYNTLIQCMRNLLSSFTRHRHIIHAGYTFAGNGSWILQDGTFSVSDFSEAFQENDVQRVLRAYPDTITMDIHCESVGLWSALPDKNFAKSCRIRINPNDVLNSGSDKINSFIDYVAPMIVPASLTDLLESSDVVGNIRFSHPTLYVFPGGQGDAALFGINGFNMLVDGGFGRKACFWDFTRHLDRLDAVLMTRISNCNINGLGAVVERKRGAHVYPQIGHFFCNVPERKGSLSPDGDKDSKDPLLISLYEKGTHLVNNLRAQNLAPQTCYQDSEPINLYHKVGHGTLDMYVLSPSRDAKEVKEFLQKWNANDSKLFQPKDTKEFVFPIQNLISICALLVWMPANPDDSITRILFPGSTPDYKIIEGLEKIKHLEFMKNPVCTTKSIAPSISSSALSKKSIKSVTGGDKTADLIISQRPMKSVERDNKTIDNKLKDEAAEKRKSAAKPRPAESAKRFEKIDNKAAETEKVAEPVKEAVKEREPAEEKEDKEKTIDESDAKTEIDTKDEEEKDSGKEKVIEPESKEALSKQASLEKDETDVTKVAVPSQSAAPATAQAKIKPTAEPKSAKKPETKPIKSRIDTRPPRSMTTQRQVIKKEEKKEISKASPTTTPKKTAPQPKETKEIKSKVASRFSRSSPSSTPAKSAKDANNRKVLESKQKVAAAKKEPTPKPAEKKEPVTKPERKPISRRAKAESPSRRPQGSPVKTARPARTKAEKDKGKLEKGGTTDSSSVSTPSADDAAIVKKVIVPTLEAKPTTERAADAPAIVDDLKEEQECIREIEAVFSRDQDKVIKKEVLIDRREVVETSKQDSTTEVEEDEEYLIIEKEEVEQYTEDSINEQESLTKEEEIQKHQRDSEESEKKRKSSVEEAQEEKPDVKDKAKVVEIIEGVDADKDVISEKKDNEPEDDDMQPDSIEEDKVPNKEQIKEEVQEIITSAKEIAKTRTESRDELAMKTEEFSTPSIDEKISSNKRTSEETNDEKGEEQIAIERQQIVEQSQPDEKFSATVESGATTAPTLPEDERIPLDEIKEDLDIVEEKYVKEETKETEDPIETVQMKKQAVQSQYSMPPPPTYEPLERQQIPTQIKFDMQQSHLRDIVKTPDEVADLPVHEEVDYVVGYDDYHQPPTTAAPSVPSTGKSIDKKTDVDHDKKTEKDILKEVENQIIPKTDLTKKCEPVKQSDITPRFSECKDEKELAEKVAEFDKIVPTKVAVPPVNEEVKSVLTDLKDKVTESVANVVDATKEKIEDKIDDVKATKDATKDDFVKASEALKDEVRDKISKVADETEQIKDNVIKAVEDTKDEVIKKIDDIKETVDEKKEAAADQTAKLNDAVVDKFNEVTENIEKETKVALDIATDAKEKLTEETKELEATIKTEVASATDKTKEIIASAKDYISKKTEDIKETVADKLEKVCDDVKDTAIDAKDKVSNEIKEIKNEIKDKIDSMAESVKDEADVKDEAIGQVADKLEEATEKAKDSTEVLNNIKENIVEDIKDTAHTVDEKVETESTTVLEGAAKLATDVRDTVVGIKDSIVEGVLDMKDSITGKVTPVAEKISEENNATVDQIKDKIDETKKETTEAVKDIIEDIEDSKDTIKDEIEDKIEGNDAFKDKLNDDVEDVMRKASPETDKLADVLKDKADKLDTKVSSEVTKDTAGEGKNLNDAVRGITDSILDFKNKLFSEAKDSKDDIKAEIIETTEQLKENVDQDKLEEVITKATEDIKSEIGDVKETVIDIKDKLTGGDDIKGEGIIFEPDVEKVVEEIKEIKTEIKDDIKTATQKLIDEAKEIKEEVIDSVKVKAAEMIEEKKDLLKDKMNDVNDLSAKLDDIKSRTAGFVDDLKINLVEARHSFLDDGVKQDETQDEKDDLKEEVLEKAESISEQMTEKAAVKDKAFESAKEEIATKLENIKEQISENIKMAVDEAKDTKVQTVEQIKKLAGDETGDVKEKLEDEISKLSGAKNEVKEEIVEEIKAVKLEATSQLGKAKEIKEDFVSKVESTAEKLFDAAKDITVDIDEQIIKPTEEIKDKVVDLTKEVTEKASDKLTEVTEQISDQAKDIKDDITNQIIKPTEEIKDKVNDLAVNDAKKQISEASDKLDDIKDKGVEIVVDKTSKLSDDISSTIDDIKGCLKDGTDEYAIKISDSITETKEKIIDNADQVKEEVKEAIIGEVSKVDDHIDSAINTVKERSQTVENAVIEAKDSVADKSVEIKEHIEETKEVATAEVEKVIDSAAAKIEEAKEKVASEVSKIGDKVEATVKETKEEFDDVIDTTASEVSKMADSATTKIEDTKDKAKDEITKVVDTVEAELTSTGSKIEETKQKVVDEANKITNSVEAKVEDVKTKTEDIVQKVSEQIETTEVADKVAKAVGATTEKIEDTKEKISAETGKVVDVVEAKIDTMKEKIEEQTKAIGDQAEDIKDKVSTEVTKTVDLAATKIDETKEKAVTELSKAADTIIDSKEKARDEVAKTVEAAAHKIEDSKEKVTIEVAKAANMIETKIDDTKDKMANAIGSASTKIEDTKEKASAEIARAADAVDEKLKVAADKIDETKAKASEEVVKAIDKVDLAIKSADAKIDETKEKVATEVAAAVDATSTKIEETKEKVTTEVAKAVDATSQKIEETKDKVSNEVTKAIDATSTKIEETKEKVSTEVTKAVDATSNKIEETKDKIESKIDATKETVDKEITKASEAVEKTIDSAKEKIESVKEEMQEKAKSGISSFFGGISQGIKSGFDKLTDKGEDKLTDAAKEIELAKKPAPPTFEIKSFPTELRETHITTLDSPINDQTERVGELKTLEKLAEQTEEEIEEMFKPTTTFQVEEIRYTSPAFDREDSSLNDIKEEEEEDHFSPPRKTSDSDKLSRSVSPRTQEDVIKIVANVAEVLKSDKDLEEIIPDFDPEELEKKLSARASPVPLHQASSPEEDAEDENVSKTVQRMLVTASSEDGGGEIEICPQGSITFEGAVSGTATPDIRSGRHSPEEVEGEEKADQPKDTSIPTTFEDEFRQVTDTKADLSFESSTSIKSIPDESKGEKSPQSSGKSTPELKTSPSSIDEKEKHELPEKMQKGEETPKSIPKITSTPPEKDESPNAVLEVDTRKESVASEHIDNITDSRRESAISSVSEKDYTKEESSIGIDDKDHSAFSDKSIEDIRDEFEKTPTKVLSLEKDEIDASFEKPGDTSEKSSDITKVETSLQDEIKTKEQVSQEILTKEEILDIDMTDDGVDEVDKLKDVKKDVAIKSPEKSPSQTESVKKDSTDTMLETLEFLKAETISSRPESVASYTSEKSETRPLSAASQASEKPAAEKIESRPESAASSIVEQKTQEPSADDKQTSPNKSESSPKSVQSQIGDISKQDSRPTSVASHITDAGIDKEQLSRPESRASDKSRSPSVLSDHFDDEILDAMPVTKAVMKETRSKSVASIMTGSMYKEHTDLKPLSALEEIHEYSKDDTNMLPKYLGSSKTSITSLNSEKIEKSPIKKSPEPATKPVDMTRSVLGDIWGEAPAVVASTESAKPSSSKASPSEQHETISLSGKSTPDIADVIEEKLSPGKPKEEVDSSAIESGHKTPPTVPVSPNIKADIMTQSMMQMTASTTIIEPEVHSGKSSPGLIQTSSESASKSTSVGQGSGVDTTESSPKPTSPFPKGIQTIKDEAKTSSGMSTPDMTRMSTPDIMDTKYLDKSETGSDSVTTVTATTITAKTTDSSETSKVADKSEKIETTVAAKSSSITSTVPTSRDVANLKSSEMRSFTPGMDDYDPHDVSSPRSDISSGQASRVVPGWTPGSSEERHVYSDDEVPSSPMSVTSHAAHSPPSKFAYEDPYDLQRSSSGVSKKSDLDIDDSQDDIPPQYGSEELKSAISISSSYRPDPMATSFYGALPEMTSAGKSEPIPIAKSGLSAKSHLMEYTSSGPSDDSLTNSFSGTSKEIEISGGLPGGIDHKFLEEADLDFEKALEEHRQVRGADVMSSITSKYEYSPTRHVIDPKSDSSKVPELPKKGGETAAAMAPATTQPSTSSSSSSLTQSSSQQSQSQPATQPPQLTKEKEDHIASWGKPLGLPAPAPIPIENNNTTPKKDSVMQQRRMVVNSKTKLNNEKNLRKRSESPVKGNKKNSPIYMDLTYVPHHGNSYYSHVEFFKRVRARYYVFSGTEPSREVYNALLEAKQTWEDKDLEVTIIPTYDTDVLGYWVSENEDLLAKYHIDLSPSASRCTINLQDHETSCSAYRLEF